MKEPFPRAGRTATMTGGSDVPLVELLDRLLDKGVGISGDVLLSVAGIDLVWLGLRAVLKGVDDSAEAPPVPASPVARGPLLEVPEGAPSAAAAGPGPVERHGRHMSPRRKVPHLAGETVDRPAAHDDRPGRRRLGIDQDDVDRGLVQLVLTVVELVRQLMERQALRRVDTGTLSDGEVERLGVALMRLSERMEDLKSQFGLSDDDLLVHVGSTSDLG